MGDTLDDHYLEWLYNVVGRQARNIDHWDLLHALNNYDFVMLVPNDDNRAKDGEELREEYVGDTRSRPSRTWMNTSCTVLEMMIGVARHLTFELDGEVGQWFWLLVDNLDLTKFNDRRFNSEWVEQVLERLVWRQYNYDGRGGLFPLKQPHEDQRHVEIWFQMEAYMLEMS
jgi:hypothetical protein